MPKLIKDTDFVENIYQPVGDDDALPQGAVIVSLDRLKAEADTLKTRNTPLGVVIRSDTQGKTLLGEDVRELAPFLSQLSMVAIDFPAFRNGRGFSTARILRDELKFDGEIRAIGDVAFDQWHFMARCGIDAFEVADNVTLDEFKTAMGELSDAYQPAAHTDKRKIKFGTKNKP